jgi:broad specificity phosphatase PhoE
MKIFLMRHGQTTGDIEDRFGGDYEDHLTDLGRAQSKELAEKLLNLNIEKIYYSPRIRAAETAEIIEKVTKIPLEIKNDLRERNAYGILTGKIKSEVADKYPDLIELLKDPKATITGAEEYDAFKNRVINIFNKITNCGLVTVGIVTHGGIISCFLREIIGRERKSLGDCAMIELEYTDGKFTIIKSDGLELEE